MSKPIIESVVVVDYWYLTAKMQTEKTWNITITNVENVAKPTVLPAIWPDISKPIGTTNLFFVCSSLKSIKMYLALTDLWVIRKPKDVRFAEKSTFPCQPMRCIYELTIKIANVPFVVKLSHAHGCFKDTYELTQVHYSEGLFSASLPMVDYHWFSCILGERPYKCNLCPKAFADKSNLRAHTQTHSNSKPFECRHCGKTFALKSYLYKHEEASCNQSKWRKRLNFHYFLRSWIKHFF